MKAACWFGGGPMEKGSDAPRQRPTRLVFLRFRARQGAESGSAMPLRDGGLMYIDAGARLLRSRLGLARWLVRRRNQWPKSRTSKCGERVSTALATPLGPCFVR